MLIFDQLLAHYLYVMFGESGHVYVREKGKLSCVDADVFQSSIYKPYRLFQKDFTVQLCGETLPAVRRERKEHFIFTYNSKGSLVYSVKPLLDISLLFIADHVEHVDSLVGFPEQVAQRLFVAAEEKQKFTESSTSVRALQVFSEAYGELVLKSLCLRNRGLLVSERIKEIQVFHQLEILDLYGCRLGDDHDIFTYITSEAFSRLVLLFFGGNCLSDKGLQRLTTPIRVMKKGLENLQLLDLSYNPLTEKGLGYLTCLKKLRELDISGTSVKLDAVLRTFFRRKMEMVLSETPLNTFTHTECKTEGWAEEVINQWEVKASQLPKKESKPRTNALQFYGREKFVRERTHSAQDPAIQDVKSTEKMSTIHFHKPHNTSQQSTETHNHTQHNTLTTLSVKKRKLSTEQEQTPPAKRQTSFSAEDLDLLNSY